MDPAAPQTGTDLLASARWLLASTPPGSTGSPSCLPDATAWVPAVVPGTVGAAQAVSDHREAADLYSAADPDALDWWYVTTVPVVAGQPLSLHAGGLATRADIWVDDDIVASSESMFTPVDVDVTPVGDTVRIALHFASLEQYLKKRRPRGRWRSSLIAQQGLRHVRTTMLGRAPVYGHVPPPVGPWRPLTLTPHNRIRTLDLAAHVTGADGVLTVRAHLRTAVASARVWVDGAAYEVDAAYAVDASEGRIDARITVANVDLWWPHTHGTPRLYDVELELDGDRYPGGRVGFRTVELDRAGGGATPIINGENVFCRGVCWTPVDPIRLWADADSLRAALTRVVDAGLNMVRVTGTLVYEQDEFFALCSELGILVWQDLMFATTDPPTDDEFTASVDGEVRAVARTVSAHPSLAVVSGGSETQQQPTMLGVPHDEQRIELLENVVPALLSDVLPGVPYVTSSPSSEGGALHTHVGVGVAHYFGVGGYLRPLSDVRTAGVRFAAESLAFAVPPERAAVERFFGSANVAGHHPDWKAAVPRDRGSSWDFEDVRDHYVRSLFDVDPHLVRRVDAELYLDYGRAAVCEAVTAAFTYWRRADSACAGALVLTGRDLVPGAGWGLLDSTGAPKAPWYSLARLSSPVALLVSDEGLDGLHVEAVNDTAAGIDATLNVTLHGTAGAETFRADAVLPARGSYVRSVDAIVGRFTDVKHAYKFGARAYSAVSVHLTQVIEGVETVLAESTVLIGAQSRQNDVGLSAVAQQSDNGVWTVTVATEWAAQYVCVDLDGDAEPSDSWFHLAPGLSRTVTVRGASGRPRGHVRALNSVKRASIGLASAAD